jgi:hypothetical protein
MLERLPSRLRPICEPMCPKCKLVMEGINLIPGFDVVSSHIFRCRKCGNIETLYREGETAWRDTSTGKT